MVSAAVNRTMCQKVQRRKKPGLSGRAGEVGREGWTENRAMDLRFLKMTRFQRDGGGGGRVGRGCSRLGNSMCEGTEAGQQAPCVL